MKIASRVALVLLLLPTLLSAQNKKRPGSTPAVFNNARYAWVEAFNGDAFTPRVVPEDRQAISDVEEALQHWNRYALTVRRNEADLVFIVRKGRIASATTSGTVEGGSGRVNRPVSSQDPLSDPSGTRTGLGVGGEAGPADDYLEIHQLNPDGSLGAIVWQHSFPEGLEAPGVTLISQLKKAVEHDYPRNPPSAKP